jgi:Pyruvate/2-oxoacid:ferredoxin oxidoreductase gamma subunit
MFGASMTFLSKAEGFAHVTAVESVVKGALESELPIATVAGSRRAPFETWSAWGGGRTAPDDILERILQRHGLELVVANDSLRAIGLAHRQVLNNRCGVAFVSNEELPAAIASIGALLPLPMRSEAGLVLVVEDNPEDVPAACPSHLLGALGIPSIEPSTLDELRDAVEQAARLCRALGVPVAIVAHTSLLRSTDTLEARPNRIVDVLDVAAAGRRARRAPRGGDAPDALRMARRLELNRLVSLPSPGEREPFGLVCVGGSFVAATHLLNETRLMGRVPVLKLGMTWPIDDSAILRLLTRCDQVILLESRVGASSNDVLAIAELARRRGEKVASIWWRDVPAPLDDADPRGERWRLADGDALRPSTLIRKLLHLLHAVRPTLQPASRLAPIPEDLEHVAVPPRGSRLGPTAAAALVRETLLEADHDLRARVPTDSESDTRRIALAVDGIAPSGEWDRVIQCETWGRRRFATEGVGAVRQAAREGRARIAIIPDVGGDDDIDLERLASASVPADAASRVSIRVADLHDRAAVREFVKSAALDVAGNDGLSIIIVRDGPPPRLDAARIERAFVETDRLGFTPKQRLTWPVDVACEMRPPTTEWLIERGLERGSRPLEGSSTVERLAVPTPFSVELRPLLEQVEITRTRPPTPALRGLDSDRIAPPRPLHASQGVWRGHIAGTRGDGIGLAASIIADAGVAMGYRVQTSHRPAPVGPGRRAWAQVLFSRGRSETERGDATTAQLVTSLPPEIPYGEADLLLGIDGVETLRGIGPIATLRVAASDRTAAVVNVGPLDDQFDEASLETYRRLVSALPAAVASEHSSAADFAVACRGRFLTDRVLDVVLVGVAFQRGLIPVTVEAMESAVRRLESRGYGRSVDAFEFGRRLAVEPRMLEWASEDDQEWRDASGMRLLRRLLLETRRSGWGGRRRAEKFGSLARESLAKLPGLDASEEGHAARRDFLVATHRCLAWGGMQLARRYADLIRSLYAADQADPTHELTRLAIRPLAEALLVRDLLHLAAMSTSVEHRRRTRDRLAVRFARGDVMERRYLNRIEVTAFGRRYRLDVRTSDWPARILTVVAPLVPERLRGSRGEQETREYVAGLIERAVRGASDNPRIWLSTVRRLAHVCAVTDGFRNVSAGEIRARVEAE